MDERNSQRSISSACRSRTHARRINTPYLNPYSSSTSRLSFGNARRQELTTAIIDNAHGFPYLRKLEAHKSCVNALTFSSGEGRFLASGGDDLLIHLWDFHQDDVATPSHTLRGPKGNIFCLNFSANNRYIYSGGTCEMVYRYDVGALGTPLEPIVHAGSPDNIYRHHDDTIRSITCHPTQDEIFLSASDDGCIILHDTRENTRLRVSTQNIIQSNCEMTGVQYNPTIEHLFASSDNSGRVSLHDTRMAFGTQIQRSGQGIVQRYNTKLTKRSAPRLSNPESSSITFDKDGTRLAVTFLHYLPSIYALSDPNPVAVLSGANLPDGTPNPPNQRTYSNSCTMKHGSFGGPGLDSDNMFAGGSDDFRAYIWRIPALPQLLAERRELSADQWDASESTSIAFTEGHNKSKFLPTEIATPFCRLTGHNSIVNTAVFHPHFLHVVTSGVEKNIVIHSPTPSSPCVQNLQRSPVNVRQLLADDADGDRQNYYAATLGIGHSTLRDIDEDSEEYTRSLFDHIIREEGNGDVFSLRRWRPPPSVDSESEEYFSEHSEEDEDMDLYSDATRPYLFLS